MDLFEEKIKALAGQEEILVPDGFAERIEEKLTGLPIRNHKRNPMVKVFLIAAIFVILSAATVFASPDVQRMTRGIISYFTPGQESAYSSQQEELQKYNSAVGAEVQDQGITLNIDNIAVDDGYINVFYTISSGSPITLVGSKNDPPAWRLSWTAPTLLFKADGRELAFPALIEQEAHLEGEKTLKGMERFAVVESLPDTFRLQIFTDQIFKVNGNWQITVNVDKSAARADTLVVTPGIKASVTSGWDQPYKHTVSVDKVLISPFGSQIVLSEMVEDGHIFAGGDFALQDDQGRFMDVFFSQLFGGPEKKTAKVTNSFEFLNGNTKMKSLTLIPLAFNLLRQKDSPEPVMVTAPLGPVPFRLQQSSLGAVVVDKIDLSEQGLKITYHADGILEPVYFPLLDENNREMTNLKMDIDSKVDRQSGQHVDTYTFTNHPSAAEIAQIKRIGTWTYDLKLRQDEAVTIPLK